MKLKDLFEGLDPRLIRVDPEAEAFGVSYDSRNVRPGEVFVAVPGLETDGHCYVARAVERGAVCAVCQHPADCGVPHAVVPSARRALAVISANWFGHPARRLTVVGVTGTNGKTTVTHFIKSILERKLGAGVGLIGTIQNVIGGEILPADRTTPESRDLQELLRRMADSGCTHAVMEVSSHALALDRVYGIPFAVGVFTNLTRDHLDFHGTMENYCDAKAKLFDSCAAAVYNADDPWHARLLRGSACHRLAYGVDAPADLRGTELDLRAEGVAFTAETDGRRIPVRVAVPGRFTVYNALAAMGACRALGIPPEDSAEALAGCAGVKGRMEVVPTPGRDCTVIIDYAHTPDALENVLRTARGFARGRVIAVFGCGGDRDRTKRPQMGAIAARLADLAVVTTDNPRTEDPAAIIADILAGMGDRRGCTVVPDRAEAIRRAMDAAGPGDVIVLCGKGHETYQVMGRTVRHLDEREIVAEYLRQ
jgi:UDP-N-acetylmuramoyl-L-alanyl-D-glutamate--2,6-diaminopimelate ligase